MHCRHQDGGNAPLADRVLDPVEEFITHHVRKVNADEDEIWRPLLDGRESRFSIDREVTLQRARFQDPLDQLSQLLLVHRNEDLPG